MILLSANMWICMPRTKMFSLLTLPSLMRNLPIWADIVNCDENKLHFSYFPFTRSRRNNILICNYLGFTKDYAGDFQVSLLTYYSQSTGLKTHMLPVHYKRFINAPKRREERSFFEASSKWSIALAK